MIPTWVAVVTGISLAILAVAAIVIAAASVVAALGLRAFLRVLRELTGPAVGDVRALVATIRTEADGLVGVALFPVVAHAWTPGTHVYLGESVLANLHQLAGAVADLLRAYPYDFLYGNIAADTSMAKKYAPVGRHCHAWHVGQEIFDLAHTDP